MGTIATLDQLRAALAIDKSALDDELIRQPMLMEQVGEAYAEACAQRDWAKEELETINSKLSHAARKRLAKDAKYKITEGMVLEEIQASPQHQKAFEDYLDAKLEADKLQALKDSFHQRGFMLRDLCNLYVSRYYEQNSVNSGHAVEATHYNAYREHAAEQRGRRK